ncbi:MAG: exodeoxyribonuclease V subunit alpha [Micropruina sp.]|nr:exodeoxyribonuclease V subunit alpha [Micropruina sp.]
MIDAAMSVSATGLLRRFHEVGVLGWADLHAAQQLCHLYDERDESVALALALTVRALRGGSVCLDLSAVRELAFETEETLEQVPDELWPEPASWHDKLTASPAVTTGADAFGSRPLRLVGQLLYLERYWRAEESVRVQLLRRQAGLVRDAPPEANARLDALFSRDPGGWQRTAAALSLVSPLTVIAGGPGTGKTATIARLLSLLLSEEPGLRIALAAPTGKAAARMDQALQEAIAGLPSEWESTLTGLSAQTLHRLLGWIPESRSRFRHNADNPLPHDVVVVDELSMVSLSLMARLMEAVRPSARLILVGDPDQLASVEAGPVLADIVAANWPSLPGAAVSLGGLAIGRLSGPVVQLRHNHRFDGAIGDLASFVRAGDADSAVGLLRSGSDQVSLSSVSEAGAALKDRVVTAARTVDWAARAGEVGEALAALDSHRLLCAHRRGPFGVAGWARRVEKWLRDDVPGFGLEGEWYTGRPVMISRNSAELGLYNGDTGLVMIRNGQPRVYFGDGRSVSPFLLEGAQTVFAMTVHKAQGSQFTSVSVVLPEADSPILSRELLYTAITRASERVTLIGTEEAVRRAIQRPARRASGLRERI